MRPPPKSVAWTSSWQMFVVYACIFLGGSLLPFGPPLQGAFLILGAFCAFFAGTMRTLDLTRPLWDRRDDSSCCGDTATCPDCGNPLRFCDCGDSELSTDEPEPSHHVPDAEVGRDELAGMALRGPARPVQPASGPPNAVRPEGVEREALEGEHAENDTGPT